MTTREQHKSETDIRAAIAALIEAEQGFNTAAEWLGKVVTEARHADISLIDIFRIAKGSRDKLPEMTNMMLRSIIHYRSQAEQAGLIHREQQEERKAREQS